MELPGPLLERKDSQRCLHRLLDKWEARLLTKALLMSKVGLINTHVVQERKKNKEKVRRKRSNKIKPRIKLVLKTKYSELEVPYTSLYFFFKLPGSQCKEGKKIG